MLRKFNIGPRLLMLIAVQAVILVLVGATAVYGLNAASQSTQLLSDNVAEAPNSTMSPTPCTMSCSVLFTVLIRAR